MILPTQNQWWNYAQILFPGSYANIGADQFSGTIIQTGGQGYLTNTLANVNFTLAVWPTVFELR